MVWADHPRIKGVGELILREPPRLLLRKVTELRKDRLLLPRGSLKGLE